MTLRRWLDAKETGGPAAAARRGRTAPFRALMLAAGVGFAAPAGGCGGPEDVTGGAELGPVVVTVVNDPVPVLAEGEIQVVYEVQVANPAENAAVRMARLTITDGSTTVASYSGGELRQMLSQPDLELLPGSGRLAYVWLSFPAGQVPARLTNTVAFDNTSETRRLAVDVTPRALTALKPPLEGDRWIAVNIGNDAGHRRAVYPTGEGLRLAQRFAIDWVQLDEDRNTHRGNQRDNRNYYAYGQPVLAVAPGRIVRVQDGIPDNEPGSRAVEITLATLGGNHVIQELSDGSSAYYAHLIPGSLRVSAGDVVRVGDTLGLVGNSGNSDEAHLHLHFARIYDPANNAVDADGLPFVFESFEIRGNRPVLGMRFREMPLNEAVIRFY